MNWIQSLSETYDNCRGFVGVEEEGSDELLLPLSHTTQNAHIEVTLDQHANLIAARVLQKEDQKTLVPCTEASGGRAGSKPTNHPLCDKLQYVAGDFLKFGGSVTSGFAKDPEAPHRNYVELLDKWQGKHPHPKVQIVLDYVKKARLIHDLVEQKVIPVCAGESGPTEFLHEWTNKESEPPPIFATLPAGNSPQDAFVRWSVTIPGDPEPHLWQDRTVWESWNEYYRSTQSFTGLCYVSGEETTLAVQHPAKLRHAADKAKLISANDDSGFTFRGRFTDKDGIQTCGVGFDVTQKAHNALRWLIARQGRRFGDQAIVAWAMTGRGIPDAFAPTDALFDEGDDFLNAGLDPDDNPLSSANTGETVALALKKKIGGYHAELGDTTGIVVLSLDSATPGRVAISYYRELTSSEYLARIEKWHTEMAWSQNLGKDRKFVGAPSPFDIAQCAYGSRLDDKLKSATCRRLLPCIIENRPIPDDLVTSCLRKASARHGLENWEWEKALGIACALFRKQQIQKQNGDYAMSLERDRKTRSYLYGRLLAVADVLEQATYQKDEKRATHAARSTQVFADRPFTTWTNIEKSLVPYKRTLAANKPALLEYFDREIREIMDAFSSAAEFAKDEKLNGEFLLAYHCQRSALRKGNKGDTPEEQSDQQ